jgi:hypothetical protein
MKRGLALFGLFAAACGETELRLQLEIRAPYNEEVSSVTLQIIEPAPAAPFSCEDLAFGNVEDDVIAFARVGEISTGALQTDLSDISREGQKIFWIDGLGDGEERIVTGCVEVGEITDTETIRIFAEPIARVTVPADTSLSALLGQPLPKPIALRVRDVLGRPIAGVAANYSVEGVAGTGSSGQTTTDESGTSSITPALPDRPGPFVLDVRVRWAESSPLFLSGVIAPMAESLTLPSRALDYRAGSIGGNRERGFVALLADTPGSVTVMAVFQNALTGIREMNESNPITGAGVPRLGLIDYSGRGRDRMIVVGDAGWFEVGADGSLAQRNVYQSPPMTTQPLRILTDGACIGARPEDEPKVIIEFREQIIGVYSTEGELIDAFALGDDPLNPIHLIASGCVTNERNTLERVLVAGFANSIGVFPLVEYVEAKRPNSMLPRFLNTTWFALPQALAFAPPLGDGRRQMFGTQLAVNDIVVARASISHPLRDQARNTGEETFDIIVEGSDKIPNVPLATTAGDIDGDKLVDAVSLFQRNETNLAVWAVLGREHSARRISADVDLGTAGLRSPQLMLVDIDRDGFDDILLGEVAENGAASRVEIYSMGPP